MHLAGGTHLATQPLGRDLAVDGDGDISTDAVLFGIDDALPKTGVLSLQRFDDLAYCFTTHLDLRGAPRQLVTPRCRYPDGRHTLSRRRRRSDSRLTRR